MPGREFSKREDIRKLQIFLAKMRQQGGQAAYFQWGDLLWRMHYPANGFDATTDIRIWCDDAGEICGFVFYHARDNNPELFLRPELYNSRIADEMFAWAVARGKAGSAAFIETSCLDGDSVKASFLKRGGFQKIDDVDVMVFMQRNLDAPIPEYHFPSEYTIVSAAECPELAGITGNHMTHTLYASITNAPGYKDDLGLRVCYRNQELVAGCICWYDDIDNCGEFEPVGTKKTHRGKGLALAVMAKTLENLKQYGADTVYVRTHEDNMPAVRLYQKLGFRIIAEDFGWKLAISG